MRKGISILCAVWAILVGLSFFFSYTNAVKKQQIFALQSARSYFDQIVLTRAWNAGHGGVYVPVTETTRPNPYLDVPNKDLSCNDGIHLTRINPAYMTRQISEIAAKAKGIQFHITSLKPIRPENAASPREKKALESFAKGNREVGEFLETSERTDFFYMAPLVAAKSCLPCHAKQGYAEGDIRGGISVTLPDIPEAETMALFIGHLVLCFVGLAGIMMFGAKLKTAYATIEQQARFDFLTCIPNRMSFSETILQEYSRSRRNSQPLSVMICDIDHFKLYNDTFGHAAGDDCLKIVANTIKTSLRRPSDFCARYGGEEFVIILPHTPLEGARKVAEMIRSNVEALNLPNPKALPLKIVTISIGIATNEDNKVPSHGELVRLADAALYRAKESGRNTVSEFIPTESS